MGKWKLGCVEVIVRVLELRTEIGKGAMGDRGGGRTV